MAEDGAGCHSRRPAHPPCTKSRSDYRTREAFADPTFFYNKAAPSVLDSLHKNIGSPASFYTDHSITEAVTDRGSHGHEVSTQAGRPSRPSAHGCWSQAATLERGVHGRAPACALAAEGQELGQHTLQQPRTENIKHHTNRDSWARILESHFLRKTISCDLSPKQKTPG